MSRAMVAIADCGAAKYPAGPYSPDTRYPEYRAEIGDSPNRVYQGVRELFRLLSLDGPNFGKPGWNPLGGLIKPGTRVLLKPNLVRHYHPLGMDAIALVTHASVIRAVCDYALLAAGENGEVVIADAPLQSCDFKAVCRLSGLDTLMSYYARLGKRVLLRDFRLVRAVVEGRSRFGKVIVRESNPGDPLGYTAINLGSGSLHSGRDTSGEGYRVACYDPSNMREHHGDGRHQYIIANTLLDADAVINLPKMKTHQKAGITGALKNFIGINGHKDCLPHHLRGASSEGGDEYMQPSKVKALDSWLQDYKDSRAGLLGKKGIAVAHRVLSSVHMREAGNSFWAGCWHGNDTISRTTVDLNRIVRYADKSGGMCQAPQRRVLSIIDGIIAGDHDGPLAATPKPAAVLLAGEDGAAVDAVMARLMGFDYRRIPTLRHALDKEHPFPLSDFEEAGMTIRSDQPGWNGMDLTRRGKSLEFIPNEGWKGNIEL
jgi:uncharacterized protein (DUF362 family)